jgi:hypothetical protein
VLSPAPAAAPGGVPARPGVAAEAVVLHAQADEHVHRAGVHITGNDGDDHRVAGHHAGRVAVEPGPAVAGAHRRGGPLGGPPGPVPGDPRVLQLGVHVQVTQIRERHVHQGLDRLPGPGRQQAGRQEAPHALT